MIKPTVLLDCDGVLRQFTKGALNIVARVTGRYYDVSDVKQYDFCRALDLTSREAEKVKDAISMQRGFASSLDVYPNVINAVRDLRAIAKVRIVTSPWSSNETWTSDTEKWLYQNFGISFPQVYHLVEKESVYGDVFVDDKADNVAKWGEAWARGRGGSRGVAIFWRTPHNAEDVTPKGAISTSSWPSVIDLVVKMAARFGSEPAQQGFAGEF